MVLVDTSVWIDFFQRPDSPSIKQLEALIKDNNRAVICGIILQEILQGIRNDGSYTLAKARLSALPFIITNKDVYLSASAIYRTLRTKGITVPAVDVTIASLAILNEIPVLTNDKHFSTIALYSDLMLY